jgi:hypothetical protein
VTQTVWFIAWMYLTGACLVLGLYIAAWARADPPATRHEILATLLLVLCWPALVVWACATVVQEVLPTWDKKERK